MSNRRLIAETMELALLLVMGFGFGGVFIGTLAQVIIRGSSDDWLALILASILAPVLIGIWNAALRDQPDPFPDYARTLWSRPRWQRRLHLLFLYLVVFLTTVQNARLWWPADWFAH